MMKKTNFIVASSLVLMLQFFTVLGLGEVSRDIPHSAWCLRERIKNNQYKDVEQFLALYLVKAPELLPDIFWDKYSGIGGNVLLFDVIDRRVDFADHANVLVLLAYTLKEAYLRKGFSEADSNQKTNDWFWTRGHSNDLFLKYCADRIGRQEVVVAQRIINTIILILMDLGGWQAVECMLSDSLPRGFSLRQHIFYAIPGCALPS